MTLSTIVFLNLMLFFACGKKNSGEQASGTNPNADTDAEFTGYPFIVGDISAYATNEPLSQLSIVFYNIDEGSAIFTRTNELGYFEIPMDELTLGDSYQLYVLSTDDKLLFGIEFGDADDLTAPTPITFNEVDDFDLGHIRLAYDSERQVDGSISQLKGELGSGFSLSEMTAVPSLGEIIPDWIEQVTFKQGIYAYDPQILLQHYLGGEALIVQYTDFQLINVTISPLSGSTLANAFAFGGGNWINELKDTQHLLKNGEKASLWVNRSSAFSKWHGESLAATLVGDYLQASGRILNISAFEQGGNVANFSVVMNFADAIGPPILVKINKAGAAATNIDFGDTDIENGLSRPFCVPGEDFTLTLSPPKLLGSSQLEIWENISIRFMYYDQDLISRDPETSDWPEDIQDGNSQETALGEETWFPELSLLSTTLASSEKQKTLNEVNIPLTQFLNQIESLDSGISYIKLVVSYENETHISAASFWFKYCD